MRLSHELRWALTGVALWTGLGYVFGPPSITSSHTLDVVRSLGVPFPAWGALYLALAVLLWAAPPSAAVLGVFLYSFWTLCLLGTVLTGTISGWSGPAWAALLVVAHHLLHRMGRDRATVG